MRNTSVQVIIRIQVKEQDSNTRVAAQPTLICHDLSERNVAII